MGWYRLYFLGPRGDIRNVDEFYMVNDDVALILADGLHDAVRDVYAGWELWQDSRRIFRCANSVASRPYISHEAITSKMQADLLRREEILQASGTAFAQSHRLLERIREGRQIVGAPGKRLPKRSSQRTA